jgi:hypothetical protein
MREVPISCGFLAFLVVVATLSHVQTVSGILSLFVNGSEALVMAGRDKDATRTVQPAPSVPTEGASIDEWCASAAPALWVGYVAAQAATRDFAGLRRLMPSALRDDEWQRIKLRDQAHSALGAWLADSSERGEIELWGRPGGRIEDSRLIPPSAVRVLKFDYEKRTASGEGLPLLYDVHVREAATASASAQWAAATTRRLLAASRMPEDAKKKKSKLAQLLEAEAQKAVKVGQLNRALKASYLENQLKDWGIWPLSSFK